MEFFLFSCGYGGIALVEDDVANLCLVIRRSRLRFVGGWTKLLAWICRDNPRVRYCLEDGEPLWERPLAISPIPYGYIDGQSRGVWCVGDQAAVIPSFTGDGMSIALHSATVAAQMYLDGKGVSAFNRRLQARLGKGIYAATTLSQAMVTGVGRNLASYGLSLIPGALRWIAASTRIPEQAMAFGPAVQGPKATIRKANIS
jgi:flavin-dependent dehydrogenase